MDHQADNLDRASFFDEQCLFRSGENDYHACRIPALLSLGEGRVIAVCEGRRDSLADDGDIDLVMKRSGDGGRTWSRMEVLLEGEGDTVGNPCLILVPEGPTVWLTFCRNNRQVLVMKSTDDGDNWSVPVEITDQVMPPGWTYIGTGPGHGIRMQNGRLIVPCWVGDDARMHGEVQASFIFYSDDGGETWKHGSVLDKDVCDECEVVELKGGTLYMNARSRHRKKQRAFSTSDDGGESWSPVEHAPSLPELSCQGSIISLQNPDLPQQDVILLAAPANTDKRCQLTISISNDGGQTWPVSRLICEGSAAYSDLAVTSDSKILCFYESDNYTRITLARFNLDWCMSSTR
ncbi:MAG: sialidase family protein [Planctomycetota bacterium]|jgi:sialidase-1|nr:sialidase family protein [Planctomycetota bacterium]